MPKPQRPMSLNIAAACLAVLVIAVGFVIRFWPQLLTTAAILVVPFGVWWLFDREKRKSAEWEAQRRARFAPPTPEPRIDPEHEARMADMRGMPASAAFWRSQPPIEPAIDPVTRARWDRDIARERADRDER